MITVKSGSVDAVVQALKKKRRISREIMVVTGRADICVLVDGSIEDINNKVIELKRIKGVDTTETLIEVEVNLGW